MNNDPDIEPIPGLPRELPAGERILWQGKPQWRSLARETFKVRFIGAYLAIFVAVRLVAGLRDTGGTTSVPKMLLPAALSLACLGILHVIAWLNAGATLYTITTKRIVLRIGVALPMTWNLPFKRLAAADVVRHRGGDGDIALQLKAPDRIAWLQLWPHAQPWHFAKARPTMRTIADPNRVAAILAHAVQSWAASESASVVVGDIESAADASGVRKVSEADQAVLTTKMVTEAGR